MRKHVDQTGFPLLPEAMGGEVMLSNDTTTSTVYIFVPPNTFQHWGSFYSGQFPAHPEWYSLLHVPQAKDDDSACTGHACVRTHNLSGTGACGPSPGKDNTAYPFAQLCMSNDEMRQYMVSHTVEKLRWDRANGQDHSLVNIAGNDQCSDSECHCPVCAAARRHDAGGSHVAYAGQSGLNLAVANHLATSLADEFPETRVMLQVYKATLTPPATTKPHPRVLLQFTTEGYAPATRNAIQPLSHPSNNLTLSQLQGWRRIVTTGDQLHIWEYVGNFCHALILQPDWYRLFEDVQLFAKLGVGGILAEGQRLRTADLHELRSWVLSSLYWDSSRDVDALISEFLAGFYSAEAAPLVLEHMQAYQNFSSRTNADASGCGCDFTTDACVTVAVLKRSFGALDTAMRAEESRNATVVAARLETLRLSPHYLLLRRWGAACAFYAQAGAAWPLPRTLGAATAGWVAAVHRLLGGEVLATEAAWVAANANSTLACG